MIRPPSRSRRAASRCVLNVPLRLIAITLSNSASSLSARVASFMTPALLTSTSTPPKAVSAESNMRATAAGSLTSAWAVTARPPASLILRTSDSAATVAPAKFDEHDKAVGRQPLRDRGADTARRAGDDRDLVGLRGHGDLLVLPRRPRRDDVTMGLFQ
jgi:hypothetical protein